MGFELTTLWRVTQNSFIIIKEHDEYRLSALTSTLKIKSTSVDSQRPYGLSKPSNLWWYLWEKKTSVYPDRGLFARFIFHLNLLPKTIFFHVC